MMGTPEVSPEAETRIALLFSPAEREKVRTILRDECGNNLPLLGHLDQVAIDRFRFAALKLSNSDLGKLRDAVRLAKTDWRDLLVAACFADDINAHKFWLPPERRW
jgi:hypothetical protein